MNKIVCDVCGTSYPDTATQCPICGNSKVNTAYTANANPSGTEGYAYVKGGRFSHANVKKMNNGQKDLPRTAAPSRPIQETPVYEEPVQEPVAQQPEAQQPAPQPAPQPVYQERPMREEPPRQPRRRPSAQQRKKERTTNMILMGIVVLLVIAILLVCIILVTKLLDMNKPTNPNPDTTTTAPKDPTHTTTTIPPQRIPCTGVRLSMPSYAFNAVGEKLLLAVTKQPANTTDPVIFTSSDPQIASVDANGLIVAVANGTVTVTVTCGEFSSSCEITCDVGVEPTYPPVTEPTTGPATGPGGTTTKPTAPAINLELNSSDITMKRKGETHNLYSGELDPAAITWSSSDSAVATVTNGIVTAVANGTATVTAEYEGQTKTCIVRVDIPAVEENVEFTLSQYEAMIAVGQSFTLKAYDADGNLIDPSELTFEIEAISEEEGNFFTVDENGVITGVKYNIDWKMKYKTLRVTYKGKTLTCLIFVTNA